MGADLLIAAEEMLRGSSNPEAVALWTGYRLGVLDSIVPAAFDGLLDRDCDGLLGIAKNGYIAGRAGMTTTEVLDQLDRERHEAVARMTGIGVKRAEAQKEP